MLHRSSAQKQALVQILSGEPILGSNAVYAKPTGGIDAAGDIARFSHRRNECSRRWK